MRSCSARRWGMVPFFTAFVSSCSSVAPEASKGNSDIAQSSDDLTGRIFYGTECNSSVVPQVDRAMAYGRAIASSTAYLQCLAVASSKLTSLGGIVNIGPYQPCSADPALPTGGALPSAMRNLARSKNDVYIRCDPTLINNENSGTGAQSGLSLNSKKQEEMTLAKILTNFQQPRVACSVSPTTPNCVTDFEYGNLAWIIYHEAMHGQGFDHMEFTTPPYRCGRPESEPVSYAGSVPYIVQECMRGTVTHTINKCGNIVGSACPGRFQVITGYDVNGNPNSTCTCVGDPHPFATTYRPPSDFNQDNKTDFVVWVPQTGNWDQEGVVFLTQWGTMGDIPVAADYDGDGTPELAVFRPWEGNWYIRGKAPIQFGAMDDIPVPGDYFGEKRDTTTVYRPSTHQWFMPGHSAVSWGTDGDLPAPADYDGDGRTDIAVFRPSDGTWHVRLDNGADQSTQWGTWGDIPMPGDYNGDGVAELVVYRPWEGNWYNRSVTQPTQWGTSGDIPVAGDFDGDMRADPAVYRPSNHTFYAKGSKTGGEIPFTTSSGIPSTARPWGMSR